MRGWLAVSVFLASAPIVIPPPGAVVISASFRRVRSTSSLGRSTSSFIKSRMLVPPARNFAFAFAVTARAAASASLARVYLNGLIVLPLLSHARQFFRFDEAPGPRCLFACLDLPHGGDDARISATAADVATHALTYLIVSEPCRRSSHVFGDVTHIAAPRLFEQPDRRADLSRRAIPALESVILNEGSLHRVKLFAARESFNGCHLVTLKCRRERQARQHATAVNEYGAGAALAHLAALLRSRKLERFAQRVEQHHARIQLKRFGRAVHLQGGRDRVLRDNGRCEYCV